MEYRRFVTYNVVGGFLWAVGLTSLGYFLGNTIPDIDKYLLPIIVLIVGVSFVPVFLELLEDAAGVEGRTEVVDAFDAPIAPLGSRFQAGSGALRTQQTDVATDRGFYAALAAAVDVSGVSSIGVALRFEKAMAPMSTRMATPAMA